ncbi:unnamed protein product [Amoebophrya sp. A25]|nr:unnamed protein product [Amoebophrya sp. A25]|eukprot:GSA25T00010918001.1
MRSKLDVSLFGRKRFAYAMKKVCNESNRLDAQLQKAAAADATAEPKPNVRSSDEFAFGYEPEDFLVSRPWIYYMKKAATCHHETRAKILQEFQGRRAFKMLEAYDARGVVAEVYDYQKHWPFVWQFKYADGTEEDVEEPARDTLFLKDAEEIADELSDGELEDVNEGDAATATTTATKVDNPRRGAKRKARAAYYATKASQAKSSQKQKAADSNTGADVDCGASADESEEHEEGEKWYHQPDSMWYQISDGEWISYSSTGAPQAASTSSAQGAPVQAEAHGSESGSSRALVDGHAAAHAAGKANAGATTQNTGKKTRRLRNIPWILVSHEDELAYKWFEAAKTGSEPSCRRLKEELLRRDYHIHKGGMHVYRDYRGRSALHFTAMTGNEQAVEALKDLVNCQDEEGRTPLHIAAWFGNRICCDKIIRYGADIDLVCYKGKKAIDYSRILGHRSTTQSLVRFGLAEDPKPREERRRVGEEHEPDSDDDPDEDNRDDMSECDREVDAKMDGDPDAADVVPSNPAVYKPYNGCEPFPPRQKVWSKWKGDYYRRTIVTASDGSRKKKWIKWQDHFQMHAPVLPDKGKGKKGRMMMMMGHNFKGGSYEPASASWDAEGANRYRGQLQTAGNGGNYTFYEQFSASPADPYTHGKGDGGMHSYGYYDEQANYARGSYTQHRPEAFSTPDTHPYPAWQPTPTTQDTWGAHSSSPDYYESAVGGTQHMTSRGYDQFNNPSDRRYQAYSGTAMMGYYGDAQANANSFAAGFAAGSAGAYSYPHPPTAPSATQHQMQLGPNPAEEPTAGDSWAAAASSSVSSHLQRLADAAFERAQLPAATGPLTALTQPPQPSTFLEQTAATRGLPLDFSENREREQDHSKDLVMGDGGVAERWNNMSTPPVLDSPSLQSDKGGLTPAPDAWGAANEELLFPKVAVNNQETRDAARDEYDAAMKIVEEDRERSSGSALSASTFPVVPVQEERPQSYFEQLLASAKRSEDSENGLGSTLEASCAPPTVAGEEFSREKQLPPGSPPPPPVSGPTAAPPPLPDHLRAKTPPPVPMSLYRPPPGFVP